MPKVTVPKRPTSAGHMASLFLLSLVVAAPLRAQTSNQTSTPASSPSIPTAQPPSAPAPASSAPQQNSSTQPPPATTQPVTTQPPTQAPANAATPSPGQQPTTPSLPNQDQPTETIKVQVNEVNLIFTVTDKKGKFITGLKRENFGLLDDGRPPSAVVQFTQQTNLPLRVGIKIGRAHV